MALVRWRDRELDSGDTLDWLQDAVSTTCSRACRSCHWRAGSSRPHDLAAVDVIEAPDRFVVECELPGMDQKDIDVTIASGVLTIKGEKKGPDGAKGRKVFRDETWQGSFQKTLSLPLNVEPDKVEAGYADGVLRITVPKSEQARAKRIALKAG